MEPIISLMEHVLQLKNISRAGWEIRGIWDPESVADHSYGTAMLALLLAKEEGLDPDIVLKIALFHDLAESITGDIVVETGGKSNAREREHKQEAERQAFNTILASFPEFHKYTTMYLEQSTREARIVKEADKLEMAMQALAYEQRAVPEELDEFWVSAKKWVFSPTGKRILADLEQKRQPPPHY